jgi:hypothetical protein
VRVTVNVLHAGLVHVLMRVFGAIAVGVRVLMLDVVVLVGGVRVRVRDVAVFVFVRMRPVVGVLLGHRCLPYA